MSKIFVTTDTHGCVDKLKEVICKCNFDNTQDTLIHLGDCVDRGLDSKGVIDFLLTIKNLIAIRGNHDDWLREYIETGFHGSQWQQGATATFASYLSDTETGLSIPETHKQFFINQKNYYVDSTNRLFVHAGFDPEQLIENQDDYMLFWNRDLIYKALSSKNKKRLNDVNDFKRVFIGHTPTLMWEKNTMPIYAAQVVDLDTGVAYGGKISIIDVTDDDNHILYQA